MLERTISGDLDAARRAEEDRNANCVGLIKNVGGGCHHDGLESDVAELPRPLVQDSQSTTARSNRAFKENCDVMALGYGVVNLVGQM